MPPPQHTADSIATCIPLDVQGSAELPGALGPRVQLFCAPLACQMATPIALDRLRNLRGGGAAHKRLTLTSETTGSDGQGWMYMLECWQRTKGWAAAMVLLCISSSAMSCSSSVRRSMVNLIVGCDGTVNSVLRPPLRASARARSWQGQGQAAARTLRRTFAAPAVHERSPADGPVRWWHAHAERTVATPSERCSVLGPAIASGSAAARTCAGAREQAQTESFARPSPRAAPFVQHGAPSRPAAHSSCSPGSARPMSQSSVGVPQRAAGTARGHPPRVVLPNPSLLHGPCLARLARSAHTLGSRTRPPVSRRTCRSRHIPKLAVHGRDTLFSPTRIALVL